MVTGDRVEQLGAHSLVEFPCPFLHEPEAEMDVAEQTPFLRDLEPRPRLEPRVRPTSWRRAAASSRSERSRGWSCTSRGRSWRRPPCARAGRRRRRGASPVRQVARKLRRNATSPRIVMTTPCRPDVRSRRRGSRGSFQLVRVAPKRRRQRDRVGALGGRAHVELQLVAVALDAPRTRTASPSANRPSRRSTSCQTRPSMRPLDRRAERQVVGAGSRAHAALARHRVRASTVASSASSAIAATAPSLGNRGGW